MSKPVQVAEETAEILSRWYGPDLPRRVVVVRGSIVGWLFGLTGQAAVTINGKVHLTPRANDLESKSGIVLLGHELFHVVQQNEMGWAPFIARYVIHWRPTHISDGKRHPMERPAYDRGEEIRASLG
ncbi:MAG: DUF4157 domain-containing protein [SAR202 cluster bacterium]|nr:DUF4157 domain-containing protein [SAR202 cluster bacterium]MDP6664273.1 DUF4157 domain-containing protein [SAR202 cluster bacterium]MDP6800377.1 DUF4157 domain-containing protein [SAR202 cluster bacterium]